MYSSSPYRKMPKVYYQLKNCNACMNPLPRDCFSSLSWSSNGGSCISCDPSTLNARGVEINSSLKIGEVLKNSLIESGLECQGCKKILKTWCFPNNLWLIAGAFRCGVPIHGYTIDKDPLDTCKCKHCKDHKMYMYRKRNN